MELFLHDRIQEYPDITVKSRTDQIIIGRRKQYLLNLKQPVPHFKPNILNYPMSFLLLVFQYRFMTCA